MSEIVPTTRTKPSPTRGNDHALVVRGMGLVTPVGHAAWPTFAALLAGKTMADRLGKLPPDLDLVTLVKATGAASFAQHSHNPVVSNIAERVGREALLDANLAEDKLPLFLASSKAALASPTDILRRASWDQPGPVPPIDAHAMLESHLATTLPVAPVQTLSASCASGLVALDCACRWLLDRRHVDAADEPSRAIVIAADAAASGPASVLYSYRRLGVLAPATTEDYRQMPLDERGAGFTLADTAAAVVLQRIERSEVTPRDIVVAFTGIANDPHALIQPNPDMPATRHLVAQAIASSPAPLQAIHPHASGTAAQDPAELRAIHETLLDAESTPSPAHLYAAKGAIGHGLGAASLASLVIAALSLRSRRLPPMPWLQQPHVLPNDSLLRMTAQFTNLADGPASALILGAGFGGHHATALLSIGSW